MVLPNRASVLGMTFVVLIILGDRGNGGGALAEAEKQSAEPPSTKENLATPLVVDLEFKDATLEEALYGILFSPNKYRIFGRTDLPVVGTVRAITLDDAMQQLEDFTGTLIVRHGDRFMVYSAGAEKDLLDTGRESITYVYKCRKSRASDLLSIVDNRPLPGFPKANEVTTKDVEKFSHHQVLSPTQHKAESKGLAAPLGAVEYQLVPNLNGILLKGSIPDIREAVDFLSTIDRPIPIVLIEVLIVQYIHQDVFSWRYRLHDGAVLKGSPYKFSDGTTLPAPNSTGYGPQPFGIDFQNMAWDPLTGGTSLAYSGIGTLTSQFKQNLTLLISENMARVVTNPHIAVTNGQAGTVMLNEKFNFVNSVATNTVITEKADTIDSVTSLHVTPTVVGPGLIHLAVNTSLSTFADVSAKTSKLPGQIINQVGTSVVLGENESLILGGLVKEEAEEARQKIPGLAKIPLVGHFFRAKNTNRRFAETVVYITPLLSQPQGYEGEYFKEVFQQLRRLQERGEEVRFEHRADHDTSNRLYRNKTKLDRQTYWQYLKDGCRLKKKEHSDCVSSDPSHSDGWKPSR